MKKKGTPEKQKGGFTKPEQGKFVEYPVQVTSDTAYL